jgi:hypothetical protein
MPAHAAVAAAAILFGQALNDHAPDGPIRRVDASLRPVAGTPRLPPRTAFIEASPDGRHVVAVVDNALRFGGGGRMTFKQPPSVLFWATARRLLAVDERHGTTVRVIDPKRRRVVRTARIQGRVYDATSDGRREVLMLGNRSARSHAVAVVSPRGKVRRVPAPDGTTFTGVEGDVVVGDLGSSRSFAMHIGGPRRNYTGHVGWGRGQRDCGGDRGRGDLVPGTLVGYDGSYLARRSLAVRAKIDPFADTACPTRLVGLGAGVLAHSAETGVEAYDGDGRVRWSFPEHADQVFTAQGRVYLQRRPDLASGYRTTVLDSATGNVISRSDQRYRLWRPQRGEYRPQQVNGNELLWDFPLPPDDGETLGPFLFVHDRPGDSARADGPLLSGGRALRLVDPDLRPTASPLRLPAGGVVLSPGGDLIASTSGRDVTVARLSDGRRLRSARFEQAPAALDWLSDRYLLSVSGRPHRPATTFERLDVQTGEVLTRRIDIDPWQMSVVGDRVLILGAPWRGREADRVLVLSADGTVEHEVPLGVKDDFASIKDNHVLAAGTVVDVDPAAGTASAHPTDIPPSLWARWVDGTQPGLFVARTPDQLLRLDPKTYLVAATAGIHTNDEVFGSGDGVILGGFFALERYSASLERMWSQPIVTLGSTGVTVAGRVYAPDGSCPVSVHILDAATGQDLRKLGNGASIVVAPGQAGIFGIFDEGC